MGTEGDNGYLQQVGQAVTEDDEWTDEAQLHVFRKELFSVCKETVYPHVYGNSDREVGGVLVGERSNVAELPRIRHAIKALSAKEQRATLTFTHESWATIHEKLDELIVATGRESLEIVGWYHSHPDFGVFLSGHDLFIQRNFFPGEQQVALVVDPIRAREGVFHWSCGEIKGLYEEEVAENWWTVRGATDAPEYPLRPVTRTARIPAHPIGVLILVGLIGVVVGTLAIALAYALA